jgi:hypothetical protein
MTKHFMILLEINDDVDFQKIYQTFNDNITRDPASTLPKANLQIYTIEDRAYKQFTRLLVKMGAVTSKTE